MGGEEDQNTEKDGIWKDPRFSHLVNDPRFKQLPEKKQKVKIDKRFEPMFNDDKFRVKYNIDKYGRKVNKSSTEDLEKFYQLESSSSSNDEDEDAETREEEVAITKDENDALDENRELLPVEVAMKLRESEIDFARGEGRILSDSSSDEESSDGNEVELYIEHVWGELDRDAPKTDESTRRLAACNMDWDRIRASDIMVLCNSFLPPGGSILSVKIYPSEYGKERLAEEEVNGPPELTKNSEKSDSHEESDGELAKEVDSENEEGDEYSMEKLREYQLNRLKYYYAVMEFDSVSTADKIYAECDGIEYESTATKLDLRFIPNDTTFEDEPKDVCEEMPDLGKYQPHLFTTTALQQAKVELTWDETNVERRELSEKLLSGKAKDISDADLRKVVAYSSEDEDDVEVSFPQISDGDSKHKVSAGDSINQYKFLLQEIDKAETEKSHKKYEMEYTWGINTSGKKPKDSNEMKKTNLTPIEKALLKKSEKNKRRKEERRKHKMGDKIKDGYSSDDLPSEIDMKDAYFAEEFANGEFEKPKNKKKNKSKKFTLSQKENDNGKKIKELELLVDEGEDGDKQHFSLKKIQDAENETKSKKRRKKLKKSRQEIEATKFKVEDNFEVDLNDRRFSAVYSSHLFNIDPTDPHYKKTKGMKAIINEKFERRNKNEFDHDRELSESDEATAKRPRKNIENKILIKNLKKKIMENKI